MEKPFLLQLESAGYLGNSPLWWAVNGSGYTQWLDSAERFTEAEADDIINGTKGSHKFAKWLHEDVRRVAKLTVDIQSMRILLKTE